jgi:hypothetical protein
MSYLIKPTNIFTGAQAPAIMSFAEKKEIAIAEAEGKSRLSDSDRWSFSYDVKYIKDRVVKKSRDDERD